ncbi:MAG: VOC family protein [Betaproteobacteria bacterium]
MVVAPSLVEGVNYIKTTLGVEPGPGGEHERMGTYNRLLRLGDEQYLEVIAVNPVAPPPGRPRWFGMDRISAKPYLATWVARTNDLGGAGEEMSRGELRWRMALSADGSMPLDGVAPTLIEWHSASPALRMAESGCSLRKLELFHPRPEEVESYLMEIGFDGPVSVMKSGEARPVAHIATPQGLRMLS